jgi:hypothetical protein
VPNPLLQPTGYATDGDRTVRDIKDHPEKYTGPYAGFEGFSRIEVRDFAAMRIAGLLGLRVQPRPSWASAEWAGLRRQVRKALDQAGIQ